ncbi:MAG: hypothetical protein HYV36_03775 [Lentisphaerae bacterium]|nr:hypothetical protein [Lentisphaerota bacterium]
MRTAMALLLLCAGVALSAPEVDEGTLKSIIATEASTQARKAFSDLAPLYHPDSAHHRVLRQMPEHARSTEMKWLPSTTATVERFSFLGADDTYAAARATIVKTPTEAGDIPPQNVPFKEIRADTLYVFRQHEGAWRVWTTTTLSMGSVPNENYKPPTLAQCGIYVPKDEELLRMFRDSRNHLDTIVEMAVADKTLRCIDRESVTPVSAVTGERLQEYRQAMIHATVQKVWREDGDRIRFEVFHKSLSMDSYEKGFIYSPRPLKSVESLDDARGEGTHYRSLEGNWYLYYTMIS